MKSRVIAAMALLCASAFTVMADEPSDKPKLKVTPSGRILMDGALYLGGNGEDGEGDAGGKFVDGVAIPDVRMGAKASYGNWKAKIDIGFAYAKVNMKDIFIEYDFNPSNLIRLGYFVQQFGLNSSTSSSMKPSMEEPTCNDFFYCNPRLLGVMYVHDVTHYLGTASAFVEGEAIKTNASAMGKQAWGLQTRQLWRPFVDPGKIAQVGISFNYSKPPYNSNGALSHDSFSYSVNFPSRVSKVTELQAVIPGANGAFKFSPELLLASDRLALEAQYYFLKVFRHTGYHDFTAQGAYGLLRGLLIAPQSYSYAHADGGLATPAPKSLEVVLGYNYTNASDSAAEVWGGIANDVNCTFNYYINKYMLARLRYSYTDVHDRRIADMMGSRHVNTVQARLQILF